MHIHDLYRFGTNIFDSSSLPFLTPVEEIAIKNKEEDDEKSGIISKKVIQQLWSEWHFRSIDAKREDVYKFPPVLDSTQYPRITFRVAKSYLFFNENCALIGAGNEFKASLNCFKVKIKLKESFQTTYRVQNSDFLPKRLQDVKTLTYQVKTTVRVKTAGVLFGKKWTKIGDLETPSEKMKTLLTADQIEKFKDLIADCSKKLNQQLVDSVRTVVTKNIDFLKETTDERQLHGTWHCTPQGMLVKREDSPSFDVVSSNTSYAMNFVVENNSPLSYADRVFFTRVLELTMEKKAELLDQAKLADEESVSIPPSKLETIPESP